MEMVMQDYRRQFESDGFLVVDRIATEVEVADICGGIDDLVRRRKESLRDGEDGLTWIFRPEEQAPGLAAGAMVRARLFAAALIDASPARIAVSSRLFYKPGQTGVETPWHQDRPYVTDPAVVRTVTCWLALDRVDADNGCMVYAPASHLDGVVAHGEALDERGFRILSTDWPEHGRPIPLRAGGCVFHHDLTRHYSGPNRRAAPRRALAIRCELMRG